MVTRLTPSERTYFRAVATIVFMNPFSSARERMMQRLVPDATLEAVREDRRALADVVEARLARLDAGGVAQIADFPADDQSALSTTFLYLTYHRFVDDLDALIERQLTATSSLAVPFARDVVADLCRRGMPEPEAIRYLGFFYQLRRAFYFIVNALTGECPSMRRLRLALWDSTFTHDMRVYNELLWNRMEDFSTLILGETGTGKGSAAAAIGRSAFIPFDPATGRFAARFTDTFVALNLSQFPETLIESELFGHRKGAFTGAIDHHQGVLERTSEHGALFLDEIGEVSVPVQIKLLQVLQERNFVPLGSHAAKRFKGRVIAATNRSLAELRAGGRMRDDFFYRLCSDVIEVPPLRQRLAELPDELAQLVALLVERMTGERSDALTAGALEALGKSLPADYAWPGNVRELEQAVRRILLTGQHGAGIAGAAALSAAGAARAGLADEADADLLAALRAGSLTADALVATYCRRLYARSGNFSEVAERTGLDRRTVKKHVQRLTEP